MSARDEIAEIELQTLALVRVREAIEEEAAEFWALFELMQEREQWEADQHATAEYERWYLDKLLMEGDAENLGMQ